VEWRGFQSSAKITVPDATARMSFKRMIARERYACQAGRQAMKTPHAQAAIRFGTAYT
jgi:hypothetical protein